MPDPHVLDLGLWDSRPAPGVQWAEPQFRGWGGLQPPRRDAVAERILERGGLPRIPGCTARPHDARLRPGPIPTGEWAVELGRRGRLAGRGRLDGRVAWRVEDRHLERPFVGGAAIRPRRPTTRHRQAGRPGGTRRLPRPCRALIVGGRHDDRGVRLCVPPLAQGGAGLDFITLSDYVTDTAWGEIGRYQPAHPGKLIVRSSEVITYRGHANNHASLRYVDHRTGPVYELGENGDLRPVRAARLRAPCSTVCTRAAGSPRSTTPGSSRPRFPASTSCAAVAPGTTRRGDRLPRCRCGRDRDRARGPEGGPAAGPEPVHPAGDPVLGGGDGRRWAERQPHRGGSSDSTTPVAPPIP